MQPGGAPTGGHGAKASAPLLASQRLIVLDHSCIPYEVSDDLRHPVVSRLQAGQDGPALTWPRMGLAEAPRAAYILTGGDAPDIPIFGEVLGDTQMMGLLDRGNWDRTHPLVDARGNSLGSIWRRDDGAVSLPFDPDEVIRNYWTERYVAIGTRRSSRRLRQIAMRNYYLTRPLMPRTTQIWLRRRYARVQTGLSFPRWPVETALADFLDLLLAIIAALADGPIPRIASWPSGHRWALVLTHDVEQAAGYRTIDPVLEIERTHSLRSCWYLVPRRYRIELEEVRNLQEEGLEVGVHGLYHDGLDLGSLSELRRRLPGIREAADSWGATGFRAPALHRHVDWMPLLGFDYDTSFPDTDPYEPMPGGCCSWLPFFIDDLVELPVTLPQDHTLFVILGHKDESVWVTKTEVLRRRSGMAMLDTHPDYLIDPRISSAYAAFLQRCVAYGDAWPALPREVSAWWRRRAKSRLERNGTGWRIVGPAALDGRIEFIGVRS